MRKGVVEGEKKGGGEAFPVKTRFVFSGLGVEM